jgi:NTE family protein
MGGGLIEGGKLVEFFRKQLNNQDIEQLSKKFACVATDLVNGREVWLREGSVVDAVRASIALPGLFTPTLRDGQLLVDGGLVNPVPVSLCRALGADIVIAVDLNWSLLGHHNRIASEAKIDKLSGLNGMAEAIFAKFRPARTKASGSSKTNEMPAMLDVLTSSLNIMQLRITQSRLAGEPADIIIHPNLANLAAMDFHQAEIAIAEGKRAAEHRLPMILELLNTA